MDEIDNIDGKCGLNGVDIEVEWQFDQSCHCSEANAGGRCTLFHHKFGAFPDSIRTAWMNRQNL